MDVPKIDPTEWKHRPAAKSQTWGCNIPFQVGVKKWTMPISAPGNKVALITRISKKQNGIIAKQFVEWREKVKCFRRQVNIVIQITKIGIANSHLIMPSESQPNFNPWSL